MLPVHFILNGKHVKPELFYSNNFVSENRYEMEVDPKNFIQTIKYYEKLRETFKYQLDGVVFAFPVESRELLGENSHDPEWSIAIKFIPEEAITTFYKSGLDILVIGNFIIKK